MNIIVLQHVAAEDPGVFLDFFREDGFRWKTVELDEGQTIPDLDPFDLMLVMGGPQDVWQEQEYPWFSSEKSAIRRFVLEMQRPYLGICLGHQLLAASTGGSVELAKTQEIGVMTVTPTDAGRYDPLLRGLPDPWMVLQWHGAEVTEVPANGEVLAKSEMCGMQVIRVGRRAYGLQCHIEITSETVRNWELIPGNSDWLERALGKEGVGAMRSAVAESLPRFNEDARIIYENFKVALKS